jgi:hypothetical protein
MDTSKLGVLQTIFLVFYAIFWGGIFNVQARWKAFHWPLIFHCYKFPQATRRLVLSILILNVVPVVYFVYAMAVLGTELPDHLPLEIALLTYVRPVVGAFAIFGIYRIWLAIIEGRPNCFYASKRSAIPVEFQHVEPIYRLWHRGGQSDGLIVDLAQGVWWKNLIPALLTVAIAAFVLYIHAPGPTWDR